MIDERAAGAHARAADGLWRGVPLAAQVVCEVHVGAFSPAGTFDGLAERLGELAAAGYTMVELMPVGAFPGTRNWGYDGVFPFAVQASYGGHEGLRRLCAAAHRVGLGITLDVVYNHPGPEGAVHEGFGPYLTDRYVTPWGNAVNVDGPGSDEVRRYFVANALWWFDAFHLDALRLDAVHGIVDPTARPLLMELTQATTARSEACGRRPLLAAESDLWQRSSTHGRSATMSQVREHGISVGVLSNTMWPRDWHDEVFRRDGVLHLIDGSVYSSEIAWTKPHPEAFRAAMAAVGATNPRTCVFVGDRPYDDVHSAQSLGMRAVLVPHSDVPPYPEVVPDAVISRLSELPSLIASW